MALPLAGLVSGTALSGLAARFGPRLVGFGRSALQGAKAALFGTPARAATTGAFAGFDLAGLVPDPIEKAVPGGARTVILSLLALGAGIVLPEVLQE